MRKIHHKIVIFTSLKYFDRKYEYQKRVGNRMSKYFILKFLSFFVFNYI